MHITIIGVGLIGGSAARDLRRTGFASHITGVVRTAARGEAAVRIGLVDETAPLEEAVRSADLIVLAIPVDGAVAMLPRVLDLVGERQTVVDMGSTKQAIVDAVRAHPRRRRFVASHPMAGTEHSGPEAALDRLFENKIGAICDAADSAPDAVACVERLYGALGMRLVRLDAATHDLHAAFVSHLPHVVSYALALATLGEAQREPNIFALAGGGFASAARLAKSSSAMWVPIFQQNRTAVLQALAGFRTALDEVSSAIAAGDVQRMRKLIDEANTIRSIIP